MYTSDIKSKKSKVRKTLIVYSAVTLFCGIFSYIYQLFGHGVYSNYMTYLFLIPLLGGVVPFAAIGMTDKLSFPGRHSLNLYNSGIATFTVGSCFKGVLEIYGTTSGYMPVYWVAGTILTSLGIGIYVLSKRAWHKDLMGFQ